MTQVSTEKTLEELAGYYRDMGTGALEDEREQIGKELARAGRTDRKLIEMQLAVCNTELASR
jgi:hypothetical protein